MEAESPKQPKRVRIADFTSRWEYTKATSRWHFDKSVDEDHAKPFKIIGHFAADFSSIIARSLAHCTPTTMNNRLRTGEKPFTADLEENDMRQIGLSTDHVLFNEVRKDDFGGDWPVEVKKMIQFLGIQRLGLGVAVHVQFPGQVFPLHIDAFPYLKMNQEQHILDDHPDAAARFTIQLQDWEWGHVWGYGNTYWKQWRRGEIAFHP